MSDEADIPRWSPDELLVPAILAGSRTTMADLGAADRAWAVLTLRDAGHTAKFIAEMMGCSVRTVYDVLADEVGQVMRRYMDTAEHFDQEHRMAASEVARLDRTLTETAMERDRYRDQLRRVLDQLMGGDSYTGPRFRCGCPRTRYNTYTAPKTGKSGCRYHRTMAQARYRERQRARDDNTPERVSGGAARRD